MAARRRFDRRCLGLVGGYLLAVALHFESYGWTAKLVMPTLVGLTLLAFLVLRSMARTALRLDDADATLAARPSVT